MSAPLLCSGLDLLQPTLDPRVISRFHVHVFQGQLPFLYATCHRLASYHHRSKHRRLSYLRIRADTVTLRRPISATDPSLALACDPIPT